MFKLTRFFTLVAVLVAGVGSLQAQVAPAPPRTARSVETSVATRVYAVARRPQVAGLTLAPLVEVGATGPGRAEVAVPEAWTWWVEPDPETCDGAKLAQLVSDLADSDIKALSLAGCARLQDADLAVLARLEKLEQLDLSGCVRLTTAALEHVHPLPALAWLRTDDTAIDPDAVNASMTRRIDERVASELRQHGLVGVAVSMVVDGRLALARGYGLADREAGVPVSPTATSFRWASISKPVTAVAALQLAERDQLDLDADVCELVPEFPRKPHVVTARQLLCHQGGIVHYANGPVVVTQRSYDVEHPFVDMVVALDKFKESPLVCEPGTAHHYTTHGFMLLGAVVERAGGKAFWPQVRERVAEPLGMSTFQPDYEWVQIQGRTQGYRRVLGLVVRSAEGDVSWKVAGGGFTSCVVDLGRFAQGLLRGSLMRPETQRAMWTAQATRGGAVTSYGLGIGVGALDGVPCYSHTGAQDKTRTVLLVLPSVQLAVAVMTNSEWAEVRGLAQDLARIALRARTPGTSSRR